VDDGHEVDLFSILKMSISEQLLFMDLVIGEWIKASYCVGHSSNKQVPSHTLQHVSQVCYLCTQLTDIRSSLIILSIRVTQIQTHKRVQVQASSCSLPIMNNFSSSFAIFWHISNRTTFTVKSMFASITATWLPS